MSTTNFVPLIKVLMNELECSNQEQLTDRLNHPLYAAKVEQFLRWKILRTAYTGRASRKQKIICSKISHASAHELPAYEGYLQITVRQHYYARYKIKLVHPFMRCITEQGRNGHCKFYPIELLEILMSEEGLPSSPSFKILQRFRTTTITKSFDWNDDKNNVKLCLPVINEENLSKSEKVYDLWGDVLPEKNKTHWFKNKDTTSSDISSSSLSTDNGDAENGDDNLCFTTDKLTMDELQKKLVDALTTIKGNDDNEEDKKEESNKDECDWCSPSKFSQVV
jgi:hypothetical protein